MDRSVEWFRARLPAGPALQELLSLPPAELVRRGRSDRGLVNLGVDVVARTNDPATAEALALAQQVAARLVTTGTMGALSPAEADALELFSLLTARPAIPVRDGRVPGDPRNWPEIGAASDWLTTRVLPAVGRLNTAAGTLAGTGFLVAPDRLITNNHVAWMLVRQPTDPGLGAPPGTWSTHAALFALRVKEANARWRASRAEAPHLDRRGELDSTVEERVLVDKVVATHPGIDLAVLRLASPLDVPPLELTSEPAAPGTRVFLVGYPASPPPASVAAHAERILGVPTLAVKRLCPGQLGATTSPLETEHDASTLGGSSGSPVIDFERRQVVALHYGMRDASTNLAAPLWLHRADETLSFLAP